MSEQQETFRFDGLAIIEFMGHRKRAGRVRTAEIGGTAVFQVETKAPDGQTVTEVYNASSLYCLTPVTEVVAEMAARQINPAPISEFDLPDRVREAVRRIDRERKAALEAGAPEHNDDSHKRDEFEEDFSDWNDVMPVPATEGQQPF